MEEESGPLTWVCDCEAVLANMAQTFSLILSRTLVSVHRVHLVGLSVINMTRRGMWVSLFWLSQSRVGLAVTTWLLPAGINVKSVDSNTSLFNAFQQQFVIVTMLGHWVLIVIHSMHRATDIKI